MSSLAPSYILSFIIASPMTSSVLNQHIQYMDDNGDHVWQSTSDFIPVQSKSFGNITIGDEMSMTFDFVWNGHLSHHSGGMFFRIGANADYGGNDCEGNWNRYPALQITNDDSPSLILYLSEIGSCSRYFELSSFGSITKGVSYHMIITFDNSTLYVSIEEEGLLPRSAVWNRSGTLPEWIGEVVPVWWMSDKFGSTEYDPANGTFSDITIRSKLVDIENEIVFIPSESVETPTPTISDAIVSTNLPTDPPSDPNTNDDTSFITQNANTNNNSGWIIVSIISLTLFLCVTILVTLYFVRQWTHSKQREKDLAEIGKTENETFKVHEDSGSPDAASSDPRSGSGDSGLTVTSTVPIIVTPPFTTVSPYRDRFKSTTFDSDAMYINVTAMPRVDTLSPAKSGSLPSLPLSMPHSTMEITRTPTSTERPNDHDHLHLQPPIMPLAHVRESVSMQVSALSVDKTS